MKPHLPSAAADYQAVSDSRNARLRCRRHDRGRTTSRRAAPLHLRRHRVLRHRIRRSAGRFQGFGNNSAWVQSGPCFELLDRAAPGTRSWLLPPQHDGSLYWPGGAVVVGSRLYVFLTRLFLDRPFGRPVGAALAVFDLPSLQLAAIHPIPFDAGRIYGGGRGVRQRLSVRVRLAKRRVRTLLRRKHVRRARVREEPRRRSGCVALPHPAPPGCATPMPRSRC